MYMYMSQKAHNIMRNLVVHGTRGYTSGTRTSPFIRATFIALMIGIASAANSYDASSENVRGRPRSGPIPESINTGKLESDRVKTLEVKDLVIHRQSGVNIKVLRSNRKVVSELDFKKVTSVEIKKESKSNTEDQKKKFIYSIRFWGLSYAEWDSANDAAKKMSKVRKNEDKIGKKDKKKKLTGPSYQSLFLDIKMNIGGLHIDDFPTKELSKLKGSFEKPIKDACANDQCIKLVGKGRVHVYRIRGDNNEYGVMVTFHLVDAGTKMTSVQPASEQTESSSDDTEKTESSSDDTESSESSEPVRLCVHPPAPHNSPIHWGRAEDLTVGSTTNSDFDMRLRRREYLADEEARRLKDEQLLRKLTSKNKKTGHDKTGHDLMADLYKGSVSKEVWVQDINTTAKKNDVFVNKSQDRKDRMTGRFR